jgi:hypothetical protein
MSNVRTSKKWLSIVARNDGTEEAIIKAMIDHEDKFSSKEGIKVTVNGFRYTIKDATKFPKM